MIINVSRKKYIFLVLLIITVIAGRSVYLAKADGTIPNLTITYIGTNKTTSQNVNGAVSDEFTVNYMVKPEDIPVASINKVEDKEIYIVIDTSGSMGRYDLSGRNLESIGKYNDPTSRIGVLKTATKNFVAQFSSQSNVKIGLVSFSNTANYGGDSIDPISATNQATLNSKIDALKVNTNYGTNTGDGIRYALNKMKNSANVKAKKYMILMSDGEPSYYMYNSKYTYGVSTWSNSYTNYNTAYGYYTTLADNGYQKQGGVGTDQYDASYDSSRSYNYAIEMSKQIKALGFTSFEVGYSSGAQETKMKTLATVSGGTYYSALDQNALTNIYNTLADKIKSNYVMQNLQLQFTLPNGLEYTGSTTDFTINGSTYTKKLPDIVYNLSSDKTVYTANSFPVQFTFRANTNGTYNIGGTGWNINYNDVNGNLINKQLPQVTYRAPELPIINGRITGQDKPVNPLNKTDPITLSCQVTPDRFIFDGTTLDQSGPKDVIFVIDTSVAMNDRILGVKNGLFDKLAGNNQLGDVKYGIVSFDSTVKDDYIPGGLTNDRGILQSKIFSLTTSSATVRNIGDAMEHAKTIFSNNGRSNSAKYMILIAADNVQYTTQQFDDVIKSNFNIITVNLGYIDPPQKVNDTVIPGADEPKNNIKDLHYSLIGKQDNGDNIRQKEDNNYFININYNNVTNTSDPDDFFNKYENWNQMNDVNQFENWIGGLLADKIKSGMVEVRPQSYTFKTKLRFKLQGKFDNADSSKLVSSTDTNYDVETPEFDVIYNFNSSTGYYEPSPMMLTKTFKVSVRDNVSTDNLQFGPGVVSYFGLGDNPMTTDISPYLLSISEQIAKFGKYNGILNNQPNILESGQPFKVDMGGTLNLGGTITGLLNISTDVSLDVQNGIVISGTIDVYSYDNNGNRTKIGSMTQSSSDSTKTTYKYSLSNSTYNNLLILYSEGLRNDADSNTVFTNNLYTKNQSKSVQIQMNNSLQIKDFGLYKGIVNKEPSILVSDQPFSIAKGANIVLGATLVGSISNDTNVKLEIQNGINLDDTIKVYSYDNDGNLTKIGIMQQVSVDPTKATYKYDGIPALNAKILLVYSEHIDSYVDSNKVYANTLYTPDGNHKEVDIKIPSDYLPYLF